MRRPRAHIRRRARDPEANRRIGHEQEILESSVAVRSKCARRKLRTLLESRQTVLNDLFRRFGSFPGFFT